MNDQTGKRRYSVLIYGAGGRQAIPVIKGFHDIGCEVTAYCQGRLDTGYLSRYTHKRLLYDKKNQENLGFYEYGKKYITTGLYNLIVPLGDEGAQYLSYNKSELEKYGHIAVNNYDVFKYAIDKAMTMHICMENHIDAPLTNESDNIVHDIDTGNIKLPVVVKPKTALGSIGFHIFTDKSSLRDYISTYDNAHGPLVIQEYVEQGKQPQYRADLFRDRDGFYKAAIVGKVTRWYPLDGGSGIYAETIHNDVIIDNCKRLLDTINWNGYANIDMVWDEKEKKAKILEINGRTGASIMLDYVAGINVSRLILENEMGLDVSDMTQYDDGKRITCLLPDILWFIKSPDRMRTKPSWFKRWGVKDTVFSWKDPLPSLGFLLSSIHSFKQSMKDRRRN